MKLFITLAALCLVLAVVVSAQDYDDEGYSGGGGGGDGYGGFSGGSGDDDYAAPRETDGSENQPGYHPQGETSGANSDGYGEGDDVAAASNVKPTLVKLLKRTR